MDLEELFDIGYLNLDEYDEARAKRAYAHDPGGVNSAFVHVDIAQYDDAGDSAEGYSRLTDIETVGTAPEVETVSTEPQTVDAPSETSTSPHDEAARKENAGVLDKNDDLQPPI